MFFLLSKLLFFLIQPLNWIIALLILAFFTKDKIRQKKILFLSLSLLIIFSNPFLINAIFQNWEVRAKRYNELEHHEVAVVLGGFTNTTARPRDRVHFNKGADRIIHAIELYKIGNIDKILISGGTSRIIGEKRSEALAIKPFLLNMGIPDSCILMDAESRNTNENAINSGEILDKKGIRGKVLLITSAFHMRRAGACFAKRDIEVTEFPTDFYSSEFYWTPAKIIVPRPDAFLLWQTILKEWIGILVYKMSGYI